MAIPSQVVFANKGTMHGGDDVVGPVVPTAMLSAAAYEEAWQAVPGWDVYFLEHSWRSWMENGGLEPPKDADKAFLGFCRNWLAKRGSP